MLCPKTLAYSGDRLWCCRFSAGWATAQLPVYTSRQALLPQNTAVAKRFNDFLKNFGAASDLMVVLEGAPRSELETFANDLAAKLRAEPEIGQATSRLDMAFFLDHAYLLMPAEGLDKLAALAKQPIPAGGLEKGLRKALSWSKDHPALGGTDTDLKTAEASLDMAAFFLEEWQRWLSAETVPTRLDWNRLLAKNGAGGMADGYFASHDGKMLFLFVHPKSASEDFKNLGPFVDKVKQVSADLAGQTKAAGLTPPTVGLTGLPAIEYEEYVNIRKDIILVIFTSAGLIGALILLVVRSVRWAVLIFIPMGLGRAVELGPGTGYRRPPDHYYCRLYRDLVRPRGRLRHLHVLAHRRGTPGRQAPGGSHRRRHRFLFCSGTDGGRRFAAHLQRPGHGRFPRLRRTGRGGGQRRADDPDQYLDSPARTLRLAATQTERHPANSTSSLPLPPGEGPGERGRFPIPVAVVLVILAIGGAIFGGVKGLGIPFDYDLLGMLPKDSQAAYYQRRMVAESDYQSEIIIFTARDMAEARRITSEAGKLKTIAQAQSLTNLFPVDAGERLHKAVSISESFAKADYARQVAELSRAGLSPKSFELLRQILENATVVIDDAEEQAFSAGHATLVERLEKVRGQLSDISAKLAVDGEQGRVRTESFLRALLSGADAGLNIISSWQQAQPLTPEQLPPTLHDRFFGADGSIAVYAFPAKSVYDPDNLDALITDVYSVSPEATGFPTTHQVFSKAVVDGFKRGTQLALVLCLLWIMAATRSVRGFALAALPLLIGGGWMLGLMALGGLRYNFANIVALPLVIALAVDYGVWFSYRWSELKGYTPLQVSLNAGKVIGLAAGTELAGLGAITLASYRGVSSLGMSITLGLGVLPDCNPRRGSGHRTVN